MSNQNPSRSNRSSKSNSSQRSIEREKVDQLIDQVFGGEVHAQRVASLADGVDGVLHAAQLGVRAIGAGLAVANGLNPRHAIKQMDRLFSNPKLSMGELLACWVKFVIAERDERRALKLVASATVEKDTVNDNVTLLVREQPLPYHTVEHHLRRVLVAI